MTKALSKNRIKYLASLRHKKYRQRYAKFLVEGMRMCEEALQSDLVEALFFTPKFPDSERGSQLIANAQGRSVDIVKVSSAEFSKLIETVHSQGVFALIRMPSPSPLSTDWREQKTVLALDAISDPGNLGTIIRTADWFAVDTLLLGLGCVELYNPKVVRSTMGSMFHLPIHGNVDLSHELPKLKACGFRICAGDAHTGTPIEDFNWPSKIVLLVGSEPKGIKPELHRLIDDFVHIPKLGQAESLNVATATGILLFTIAKS
jgi:TrmH family RNA methyltransferase